MNKRQKIIVSITGIFLVLLILIGLTYAYFLTRIEGNTNTKSISVTTADLKLVYRDGSPNIEVENIQPGNTVYTKIFTVTNEGNATVTNYQVYLENVVNELNRTPDLVYTLDCYINDVETTKCTNRIDDETEYPKLNGTLVQNTIAVGETHTYTFTLKYKEMNVDQSEDMGKVIGGKFNIYDQNDLNTLTLGHYIMNNNEQKGVATNPYNGNEKGLFKTDDDYGESWYFRGFESNNYVSFANFRWRIVRINGDGSVRLILDDFVRNENGDLLYTQYNENDNDNVYVGYMFGTPGSTTYDDTHKNINSSVAKNHVDNWYVTYIENETNNIYYQKYLADTLFCGDKTIATKDEALEADDFYTNENGTASGTESILYYALYRDGILETVTLKCADSNSSWYSNNAGIYSRYTSKIDMSTETNLGIKVNNDLTYPVGIISADEVYFAAGALQTGMMGYGIPHMWTMTPSSFDLQAHIHPALWQSNISYEWNVTDTMGLKPVINLKANNLISAGDGTINGPYEIKEY